MPIRLIAFLLLILIALSGIVVYVVRKASFSARLGDRGRRTLMAISFTALFTPLLLRATGLAHGSVAVQVVSMIGFSIALTMLIAAALMLPFEALRGLAQWIRRRRTPKNEIQEASKVESATPELPSRREFIERAGIGLALGVGASTSIYGITLGRHDYVTEEVPIVLRNLPRSLDGYTIVQLSDLHVGMFVAERELRAGIELVQRARPDLIVLTGDLIDHDPAHIPALGRFVRHLREISGRDGVVAIPGNHDYYTGVEQVLATLRDAGAEVLRNQSRTIGEGRNAFVLAGVDDVWAPRNGYGSGADLDLALRDAPTDLAKVLLCHNPEYFPEIAERVDLQLSGHTHGGQVNLLVRPADLVLRHGYIAGHYSRGESQIYVNRGFGTAGPPARVGAAPEVSRIVLATS